MRALVYLFISLSGWDHSDLGVHLFFLSGFWLGMFWGLSVGFWSAFLWFVLFSALGLSFFGLCGVRFGGVVCFLVFPLSCHFGDFLIY